MARAEVVHSQDAVTVIFKGDPRRPEPSTAVIKFPGGHVEVSRASDGSYWAHVEVQAAVDHDERPAGQIVASRIDYRHGMGHGIPPMPADDFIQHIAVQISRRT